MWKSVLLGLLLVSMMALSSSCISLVGSSGPLPASLILLGAGTKWAAHNGATAAYVDWYDHLVAHPNPSIPDPNAFLLFRSAVMSALFLNGFAVDAMADIPHDLSLYDVVVLEAYFACEPGNEPAIRDYLANGGGVVVLAASMCYLVYYNKTFYTGTDLAPIADWFGATRLVNTGGNASLTVDNPFGIASEAGDTLIVGVSDWYAGVTGVDASSHIIATWSSDSTFAFTKEYGPGRVYYQAKDFEPNSPLSQTAAVSIMPAVVTVGIGRDFTVEIVVNNITDLYSWELKLFYSSTVMNCTGVVEGNFLRLGRDTLLVVSYKSDYNATHGMLRLGSSLIGAVPGVSGGGTLASIGFQALEVGNTSMEMLDTVMLNSELQDIAHDTVSGFVQVRQSMHDIAVSSVFLNKGAVGQSYNADITVTVENQGDFDETFDVTVSYNSSIAGMQTVTNLAPDSTVTLTFVWNTTGVSKGYYSIGGTADNATDEQDLADNILFCANMVYVGVPGDVNGDHEVNMRDIAPICRFFMTALGDPQYAATYDITNDGKIDMKDVGIAARNFGATDP